MTEKLAQLLAMSNIKESTFVLWNTRHRITLASPISQSPHLVKRHNVPESLKLVTVYKRYIPFLISWYGLLEDQYSIIAIKKSSHQSVALKKYMIYDGHRILPWGGADGGKVKRELFDKKFTSSLEAESGYRYKRTKYIQDITAAIHNPKYMRDWVKKPQVRYKMMYKTLHFLARSGIDPLLFAKATGSFSDSIKKQIIKRAQQDPSDQMTKFIVYRGNRIMLTRYLLRSTSRDLIIFIAPTAFLNLYNTLGMLLAYGQWIIIPRINF